MCSGGWQMGSANHRSGRPTREPKGSAAGARSLWSPLGWSAWVRGVGCPLWALPCLSVPQATCDLTGRVLASCPSVQAVSLRCLPRWPPRVHSGCQRPVLSTAAGASCRSGSQTASRAPQSPRRLLCCCCCSPEPVLGPRGLCAPPLPPCLCCAPALCLVRLPRGLRVSRSLRTQP